MSKDREDWRTRVRQLNKTLEGLAKGTPASANDAHDTAIAYAHNVPVADLRLNAATLRWDTIKQKLIVTSSPQAGLTVDDFREVGIKDAHLISTAESCAEFEVPGRQNLAHLYRVRHTLPEPLPQGAMEYLHKGFRRDKEAQEALGDTEVQFLASAARI